ncbi:hypothetical protein BDV12DRAFT_199385 [Aspergillus spectabilis]
MSWMKYCNFSLRAQDVFPQPSSDPNDPLNWSWRRKTHNRVWQVLWTFIGVAITCALAPAYPMIEADTGIPAANITTGVGLMYLFLGWGNVIVQPWAMHFGRRQVLLASLLATSYSSVVCIRQVQRGVVCQPHPDGHRSIIHPRERCLYAENFGSEPYNFTTNQTGLTYLANVIGSTIGCFLAGYLRDFVAEALVRRNHGIKVPEHLLWLALIPLLLHPAGFFLYGIGAAQKLHWVALVFGVGFISATLPMGSLIALNYVIDCYKEAASEAFVAVILIRNTMGFVITYAISPMISDMGLQNAFILVGCLGAAIWGTCFLAIWAGKSWRSHSAKTYWGIVEEFNPQAH